MEVIKRAEGKTLQKLGVTFRILLKT